jgi:hypothetical protein
MQTIYIDISNKGVIPTIYTKQGDIGRKFLVVFTDAGKSYQIPQGALFSVWYDGDSGEGNYTDIGESSAFSIDGNKVTVEIISQMVGTPGSGVICLVMTKATGGQIGSWNIPYICEEVPGIGSEVATEYYTAFSKALEELQEITENLTPEAVGAAPAGYGFGEQVAKAQDWNHHYRTGVYKERTNSPDGNALWYGISCVSSYGEVTNIAFNPNTTNGSTMAIRHHKGTTPFAWEYVNPPMLEGVEYRTTERFNGKPVYARLINCGSLPNANFKNFYIAPNILDIVRIDGYLEHNANYTDKIPISQVTNADIRLYTDTTLQIITTSDQSAWDAHIAVYYTLSE